MFKAIRVTILVLILVFVSVSTWLSQSRSTDWNNSLWVKVYPVNADGSERSRRYIASLTIDSFDSIEDFVAREIKKYGHDLARPVRMELGREIKEQPPSPGPAPGKLQVMWWSLKLRWWASRVAHEFLHTLGASDKYNPADGMPVYPTGFAEPEKSPRFPQRYAEIMGGRIAISDGDAIVPQSLKYVVIGARTAQEIRLR
jgi:hypothetical protein